MPGTTSEPRKKPTGAPRLSVATPRRRLYLRDRLYEAAVERVRAGQYPNLTALIELALSEYLSLLRQDERQAEGLPVYGGVDGPEQRANRRRSFLDRRACEGVPVPLRKLEQSRGSERLDVFTSAPAPDGDDDLFGMTPLLSADEQAALEALGEWLPDLFEGESNQHVSPAMVSHARPQGALPSPATEPRARRRRAK
jgi:hypothetical protein